MEQPLQSIGLKASRSRTANKHHFNNVDRGNRGNVIREMKVEDVQANFEDFPTSSRFDFLTLIVATSSAISSNENGASDH